MPLPDERPRQSVANLIGRFEKQKSSSGAASPPALPRISSVASHPTEGFAQEEFKGKREWPPKSNNVTLISPTVGSPGKQISPPSFTPALEQETPIPPGTAISSPSTEVAEAKPSSRSLPPSVSPVASPSLPQSRTKATAVRPASSVKSPTPKATVDSSSATPLRPTASAGSNSTPLKPQHTGQSVTSAHSAARVAAKRVSAPPKPATATPTRPKTPQTTVRSKTPSSNARSKTPSSGLYAPTAASLARSKASPPAPPPTTKPKRKMTADLLKPTAASASRIRSPANTPTKDGKTSAGRPTATKAIVKPTTNKAATPARQSATHAGKAVPRRGEDSNTKKAASTFEPAANAGTRTTDAGSIVEVTVTSPHERMPDSIQPLASAMVDEADPEDANDDLHTHEDALSEEEHHFGDESYGSHDEAEVENYDDDFPDVSHDVRGDHENGHIEEVGSAVTILDELSVVAEPCQRHGVEPLDATRGLNDSSLVSEEGHLHPADVGDQSRLVPLISLDISPDPHHLADIVHPKSYEGVIGRSEAAKMDTGTIGTDLEDLVNLLESGPHIPRPSLIEDSSSASLLEAGEIPDEY